MKTYKIEEIFSNEEIGMRSDEFSLAINGLISKGLVEEVVIDGVINYRLTNIGVQIGSHLDSNIKEQN